MMNDSESKSAFRSAAESRKRHRQSPWVSQAGSCDGPLPWSPSHECGSLLCISKDGVASSRVQSSTGTAF